MRSLVVRSAQLRAPECALVARAAKKKLENRVHTENHASRRDALFFRAPRAPREGTIWLAQSIAILGLPSDKLILSGCLTASYDGWRRIKDATARA